MEIDKIRIKNLRNAEYYQFLTAACDIFTKHKIDSDNLQTLYDALTDCLNLAEKAMAVEKKNEKIREKNEMDAYRDKLHSKLFNYMKHILYDEQDARFDDAQDVMRVIKQAGNPTQTAENAESALITALGNKLEPYNDKLIAIGAKQIVDALMEANKKFIILENEAREITAEQNLNKILSMGEVRKIANPIYRNIINAINGYANIPSKKTIYEDMIHEMNVLVNKYDLLLLARKNNKKQK
jgi:hypothetical protein